MIPPSPPPCRSLASSRPSRRPARFFNGTPEDIPWQELRGTQQFDFGYALTVHKAQGSQWGDVILYDESGIFREDARRFLYTGITRASETVTVVI